MTSSQLRAEAGSGPSSASVACPVKATVSPTFQVRLPAGASITGTGGVLGMGVSLTTMVIGSLTAAAPR